MADKIVQLQDSTGDNIFPVTDPEITMTDVDPGEGATLAAGKYTAVYGASTILDMFYPVGSYYETSNTSFDPNVSWGGTWVEDSAGRVTVAKDTGTFDTVGDTGGAETHKHTIEAHMRIWFGAAAGEGSSIFDIIDENGNRGIVTQGMGQMQTGSTARNAALSSSVTSFTHDGFGQKTIGSSYRGTTVQPYIVVKRWHRTA